MTYFPTLLTLTGVLVLSVISPGRNFVLVTPTAFGASGRAGLFAVMVPAHAPPWLHGPVLALATAISGLWYGALAQPLSAGAVRARYLRKRSWLEAAMGVALTGLGGRMLFSH